MSDRTKRVVINGSKLDWTNIISGVPQGSVLGTLLLLICINGIDLGISSTQTKFAEDTKIFRGTKSVDDIILQKDINKLPS